MAIRIDLLPRYVALRRWFKRISAICLMLVGAFAAVLGLIYYRDQLYLTKLKNDRENIKVFADRTDAAEAAAQAAEAQAKPMQDTVNFFVDAGRTGSERAALLDLIRQSVYNGAVIGNLDISDGKKVVFTGMVRTPDDYARFLLKLRRNAAPTGILFTNLPVASAISGWPNKSGATTGAGAAPVASPVGAPGAPGQPGGTGQTGTVTSDDTLYYVFDNKVEASAELRNPIIIPAVPGSTPGAGAPGAAPGAPGVPGAAPGAPPGAPGATP